MEPLVTVEGVVLRSGFLALFVLWGCAVFVLACDSPGSVQSPPDGGPPLVLDVLTPPGSQIGLHYNKSVVLRVAYHVDDAGAKAVVGGTVRFSIFGDPAGSTLSTDHGTTDENGVAQVTLTGGAAEATFRVTASAVNAPDAEFQIAVSKLDFVELKVQLEWDASAPTTLVALLYANQPCAQLPPTPTAPTALRQGQKPGPSGTIDFINLLSMNYSVVGRAQDATGRLLAEGCLDVPSALAPAGSTGTLPLPLVAVTPSVTGSYGLTSSLTISPAAIASASGPWHALSDCPNGLAQALLDATSAELTSTTLKTAIASERGAATGTPPCRPSMMSSTNTLDLDLQTLLGITGAPAVDLAAMVSDLDTLVASAQLTSQLSITAAGPGSASSSVALSGEHALGKLTLGGAALSVAIDLTASGLPIIDVKDVPIGYDQGALTIGAHGFTLQLPSLWQQAFETSAIGSRFAALMPPSTRGWLGLAVGAVSHGGMSGCSGVEDLICTRTAAPGCAGKIAPACLTALDQLTTQLEAGFVPTPGLDFVLTGQCDAVDSDGNLAVDQLTSGSWTTPVAATASFTGVLQ